MPCKQMVTNCWNENQQLQPWLFVRHLWQTKSSRYKSFYMYFNSKSIQYPSKVNSMQTEVMHYSIQNLKVLEINRISTLRINKRCWMICSTVRFFWLPFELGWFQRRSSSYSASVKSFETSRQTWFFSWDDILLINSYHMRCKHGKAFTGIHHFC